MTPLYFRQSDESIGEHTCVVKCFSPLWRKVCRYVHSRRGKWTPMATIVFRQYGSYALTI